MAGAVMNPRRIARAVVPPVVWDGLRSLKRELAYRRYAANGGVPFGVGYSLHQERYITSALNDAALLARFGRGDRLPAGYGVAIDERCVEYPWIVAQLDASTGTLLDAGSTLNHRFLIDLPVLRAKALDILTLAPEDNCFWQRGVSYLFHDLRRLPIRDGYYDTVCCVSTLEHIGCDNSNYTGRASDREHRPQDYLIALEELCRVLKPSGSLLITVPFGVYCNLGVQQQFDGTMLASARHVLAQWGEPKETFYRYSASGWDVASEADCADSRYVEWSAQLWAKGTVPKLLPVESDRAVAARAVACLQLRKASVGPQ